ncbi:MAG: sulfurtransferase [Desulfobacterales bacterium]|nr:sulfurtransferase [Desulfobacterales bacterium]
MGGRSRVAAQMLAGRGYEQVYNVSGGIEAWGAQVAVGDPTLGMELFTDLESPVEALKTAYSLEQGLREFYLDMAKQTGNPSVKAMFSQLSEVEVKHQASIYAIYQELTDAPLGKFEFEAQAAMKAMEGGRTTGEYLAAFGGDMDSEVVVISLAMSIEAQALDLYLRAGELVDNTDSKAVFLRIANEEKTHLQSLGDLMEQVSAQ